MTTKAESMAEEVREYYAPYSTQANQIAAMLTVQNTLLNESMGMLKDFVTNTNQAIARERALILISAITDNNYPMGAVMDIRPTLKALKELNNS
jgi:hypothetical protein